MKKNITNKILMVRPISFAFNEQTAVNNHYQKKSVYKITYSNNQKNYSNLFFFIK